ncbi:CocE/NonD family hydrolase [Planococcus sp. APC 4015]|nr:CocE/NonD family hydrolase [Planococcus sp. APC 4015]
MTVHSAGTAAGERKLNGPQTTGRAYRDLSDPVFAMTVDQDVAVIVRDGTVLYADVHRPDAPGRYPVLVSVSPYPRQIQDLGAPMGFIEAGASDFFVPRGYVHVIANLRGTGGSEGTFAFFDGQEGRDAHDIVEWAAVQDWSTGEVGMLGISYFAMTQLAAAVERPPHLRAIMPLAVTPDLYDAAQHHGLASTAFITPFLTMVGVTTRAPDSLWRSKLVDAVRTVLATPALHAKFGHMNGEASITMLHNLMRLPHAEHPWDDLWRETIVAHPLRDPWWDERNRLPDLGLIDIPVYLGCDWQNVPLHLPGTFTALEALTASPEVRVAMLGDFGLTWPWESLHVEALAWFDHWLKGRDTGILDGPRIRYILPEADEWRTSDQWPPVESTLQPWTFAADGTLAPASDPDPGERSFMVLGEGVGDDRRRPSDPASSLQWTSTPLVGDLDVVGDIEVRLIARTTATDTAWIVTLFDVAPDETAVPVTAGYLRASLREVDESVSRDGAPVLPCRSAIVVPVGEEIEYRIPVVPNARRFAAGHRVRVEVRSEDQSTEATPIMGFRHATVGTSSINTVTARSHILLPVGAPHA